MLVSRLRLRPLGCHGPSWRCRFLSSSVRAYHENPLGLPRSSPSSKLPVKRSIPGVKRVVLVSSAKGGVGKSTIATNVALALHSLGKRVGILDADVFGPSIPRLLRLSGEPRILDDGMLMPLSNYGVESMSMGYLVPAENAVVWRGLMVMKALQQLLFEVQWSNLDYLIIDMPPGTGDTQLTISQLVKVDGAVIVSTPQDIALIDAVKGVTMFRKVAIPILGLVQNMSYFVCPLCSHELHIFGSDGAIREAKKLGLDILGSVPLSEAVCQLSDDGKPIVVSRPDLELSKPYLKIALQVIERLES